jgi:hypothetical protein
MLECQYFGCERGDARVEKLKSATKSMQTYSVGVYPYGENPKLVGAILAALRMG